MTNVLARGTTTILGLLSGTLQEDDRAEVADILQDT
jgi:hypothetical protein